MENKENGESNPLDNNKDENKDNTYHRTMSNIGQILYF